ncbi:MAG: SPFH domain-containing protein [Thermoplasmata archaeon]
MFKKQAQVGSGDSVIGATTIIWEDQYKETNIMWKVPRNIRLNDNIVVREDEIAVFFRDGKVLTYFDKPDRYALTSLNAPVAGKLVQFLSGVQQQAEVYYLQRRFLDGKFGSKEPYIFNDADFGIVNLRVFGEYRYRISHPENFINQFVGTFNVETSADVESRMKDQMVILVYDTLGKMKAQGLKVTDLAANLTNIEQAVLANSPSHFDQYGLEINKISGLSINLPDEVQKAIDLRSQMSVLGVNYMQYQAGQAMVDAAKNPSGGAGAMTGLGVGLGAGMGVGGMMGGTMAGQMSQQQNQKKCIKCGAMIDANAKFCPVCGADQTQTAATITCPNCKAVVPAGTKFCPNCGTKLSGTITCPNCHAEVPVGTKFCPNCGYKITGA